MACYPLVSRFSVAPAPCHAKLGLVDTNVLLDLVTDDPQWADWSVRQLDAAFLRGDLVINDVDNFADLCRWDSCKSKPET